MANETGDKAACYHLARQYENQVSLCKYCNIVLRNYVNQMGKECPPERNVGSL